MLRNSPADNSTEPQNSRWTAFLRDGRGVSVPVDYVLGLLILLALSGVFVGGVQQITDSREEAVTEQELDRIGSEVASSISEADTLATEAETRESRAGATGPVDVETRVQLPSQVNDDAYTVSVVQDTNNEVTVIVQSEGHSVNTTVQVSRTVEDASTGNDDLIVTYDSGTGNLIVEDAT